MPGISPNWEKIRTIVRMREDGRTYLSIGKELGLSRQRVHQLHWYAVNYWRSKALGATFKPDYHSHVGVRMTICVGCAKEMEAVASSVEPQEVGLVKVPEKPLAPDPQVE